MINVTIMRDNLPLDNRALDDFPRGRLRAWFADLFLPPFSNDANSGPGPCPDRRGRPRSFYDTGTNPLPCGRGGGAAGARGGPGSPTGPIARKDTGTKPVNVGASAGLPHLLDGSEAHIFLGASLRNRTDASGSDNASFTHSHGARRSSADDSLFNFSLSKYKRARLGSSVVLAHKRWQAVPGPVADADLHIVMVMTARSLPVVFPAVDFDTACPRHGWLI